MNARAKKAHPPTLEWAPLDDLLLDPNNPRLSRNERDPNLPQDQVQQLIERQWTLHELAVSFLENGYWPQEAVIVVEEEIYGRRQKVVVEGNRRLAALRKLYKIATKQITPDRKWSEIAEPSDWKSIKRMCERIPYIKMESRAVVSSYLGFRHVSGIKEWRPAEKAEFISRLIENDGLGYDDVRKRIGSTMEAVRRLYVTFSLLTAR